MSAGPPSELARAIEAILTDDGWPMSGERTATCEVLRTTFAGTSESWSCEVRVFAEQGQLTFDSILPSSVPDERRPEACLLIVQANWELLTGAFLLDLESGELRFRTSLLLPADAQPPGPIVLGMAYANVLTVDRCLADLMALVNGEGAVEETLQRLGL